MIIGEQLHHSGLQLARLLGPPGQNTPRSISAGARVLNLIKCPHKCETTFPTRVDPDTEASPEKESPMRLACIFDNVATMAELAKYTEADEEVRSSDVWELVEKEMDRR